MIQKTVLSGAHLFGDECGVAILSCNRYVAVIQEVESFIQLLLQLGREAALIHVGTTVQNHLSGLRGVSVQDNKISGRFSVALQDPLQILDLVLQLRRVTLPVQNRGCETEDTRAT